MPRPARPHPCAKTGASCTLVLAKQVGYGNVMTMIRTFKRYENTTPGKYRENFEDGGTTENVGTPTHSRDQGTRQTVR